MRYISEKEVRDAVSMKDIIEAVKTAFSMTESGMIEAPLRTVVKTNNGSLLFMPAYSSSLKLAVLKNVNVFPENVGRGLDTTPAQIMLIDATTGYVLAILDGTTVTKFRTGAASGAAFDILANKDCRKGALIGTGGQAKAQLEAMLAARQLEEVSVFSRTQDRCAAFVEQVKSEFSVNSVAIKCAGSADECMEDADMIVTVTTSADPVFDGSKIKRGATVSCVGNYEPDKHEIDPALIARADKIYCDCKESVLSESGDILIPLRQGLISESDICGGLGEVINGVIPGRETDNEIIVFKTVGIAGQDLLTSALIFDRIR